MNEQGTIGWADVDDVIDFGEGDHENLPLYRVTLTAGRDVSRDREEGAQGEQVLCRWGLLIDWVPPKGTQCIVAFPEGMRSITAGGVIVGVIKKNGSQFKTDRAVLDLGDGVHVLLKGRSVTISDYAGPSRYITVGVPRAGGPSGLMAADETGSGFTVQAGTIGLFCASGGDAKAVLQMQPTAIAAFVKGQSLLRLDADAYVAGTRCTVQGAGVYLGKNPTPLNTALWGPTGVAGTPSPSVFFSAT